MLDKLEKSLRDSFGQPIKVLQVSEKETLPNGIRDKYQCFWCFILKRKKLLLKPFGAVRTSQTIQEFHQIRDNTDYEPVLLLEKSTPAKRSILISNGLAYIHPETDIFLPGDNFLRLRAARKTPPREPQFRFTAGTQLVYLYLLYNDLDYFSASYLARELGVSHSTANRALYDFEAYRLIHTKGENTHKQHIRLKREEFWEKGQDHLESPVLNVTYLKQMPPKNKLHWLYAGDSYLDEDIIPPVIAVPSPLVKNIDKDNILEDDYVTEDGYVAAQIWKYSPNQFGIDGKADLVSVYLSLPDNKRRELEPAIRELLSNP